jgi:hypothetical protein
MTYITSNTSVNRFRRRRGRVLQGIIARLAAHLGRDIRILDVGGRPDYWGNVGLEGIAHIELLNIKETELGRNLPEGARPGLFSTRVGDARALDGHADGSVDLVHSNSVIEHVGGWSDMAAMARELRRVGRAGWVQTPAWSFPFEPHFRAPFLHWFARPVQVRLLSLSLRKGTRGLDLYTRRVRVEQINLLTRREMELLFPDCALRVERVIFAKSYSACWLPEEFARGVRSDVGRDVARDGGREGSPGVPGDRAIAAC